MTAWHFARTMGLAATANDSSSDAALAAVQELAALRVSLLGYSFDCQLTLMQVKLLSSLFRNSTSPSRPPPSMCRI